MSLTESNIEVLSGHNLQNIFLIEYVFKENLIFPSLGLLLHGCFWIIKPTHYINLAYFDFILNERIFLVYIFYFPSPRMFWKCLYYMFWKFLQAIVLAHFCSKIFLPKHLALSNTNSYAFLTPWENLGKTNHPVPTKHLYGRTARPLF